MFYSKTARELLELCYKFEVDVSENELSVKFGLGVVPSVSTRWPSNRIVTI